MHPGDMARLSVITKHLQVYQCRSAALVVHWMTLDERKRIFKVNPGKTKNHKNIEYNASPSPI